MMMLSSSDLLRQMSPISLPDPHTIVRVSKQPVFDASGREVPFGNIFNERETIVVFIRHFFCGSCQAYVSQLASVHSEALERANKQLVIVGCGEFQAINAYAETTKFKGPIYTDPSRSLYRLLKLVDSNLKTTPAGQERKSYLYNLPFIRVLFGSLWSGPLKHPSLIGKQGNVSQLGAFLYLILISEILNIISLILI
ncbi:hypothetical protein C8Q75DRAFT_158108 [Abortiporus biennis]|nr:hypothetical protein C8Q75DRAFT_158108 [Abortiporus biennis]